MTRLSATLSASVLTSECLPNYPNYPNYPSLSATNGHPNYPNYPNYPSLSATNGHPTGFTRCFACLIMDRMDLLMASLASCLFAGDVQVPLVHVADAPEP